MARRQSRDNNTLHTEPRAARNMPEKLITHAEIEKLSRNAITVFAVRCAQRVVPLIDFYAPATRPEDRKLVADTLNMAIESAKTGVELEQLTTQLSGLGRARLVSAGKAHDNFTDALGCAFVVISCVGHAVSAAEDILYPGREVKQAASASASSVVACEAISELVQDKCLAECKYDLAKLLETDCNSGYDPANLGSHWVDGVPDGWPT